VAGEQDAIKVERFALEPVGAGKHNVTALGTGVSSSVITFTRMRVFWYGLSRW
jgi:hypothetical protein